MQTINTPFGDFTFEPKNFILGDKTIDKVISKENLLIFQKIMKKHDVNFSLAYGTLLGAIREHDFINHDEDIDVAIVEEERNNLLGSLFDLKKNGFTVGRYANDILSVIRNDEYIDIYIFKKIKFGYRQFGYEIIKEKFLIETIEYSFKDSLFNIPKEYIKYLEIHYGSDWRTPKKNAHACNPGAYLTIKLFIQNNLYPLFKIISHLKKKLFNKPTR